MVERLRLLLCGVVAPVGGVDNKVPQLHTTIVWEFILWVAKPLGLFQHCQFLKLCLSNNLLSLELIGFVYPEVKGTFSVS